MFNNLLSLAYTDTGRGEREEGETDRGRPKEKYQRQTERDEME